MVCVMVRRPCKAEMEAKISPIHINLDERSSARDPPLYGESTHSWAVANTQAPCDGDVHQQRRDSKARSSLNLHSIPARTTGLTARCVEELGGAGGERSVLSNGRSVEKAALGRDTGAQAQRHWRREAR
jgi:hypothetical protein